MNGRYNLGDAVLDGWKLTRFIGRGSFGRVFEAERLPSGTSGIAEKAAIKIITISDNQPEMDLTRANGFDDGSAADGVFDHIYETEMETSRTELTGSMSMQTSRTELIEIGSRAMQTSRTELTEIGSKANDFFKPRSVKPSCDLLVEEMMQEIALMSQLKAKENIVNYEDHSVIPHENGMGWDIIIRMELLSIFTENPPNTRKEVIKLGIDICRALEQCWQQKIIHRDIKRSNIMVSGSGGYKLGDFGLARKVEKKTSKLSKEGTYDYMAPEVAQDVPYGPGADIYSLGILLYKQLNNYRIPFLTEKHVTDKALYRAIEKRLSGKEELPLPRNASGMLADIVMKACAFEQGDRYDTPAQMRTELEALLHSGECPDLNEPLRHTGFRRDGKTIRSTVKIKNWPAPLPESKQDSGQKQGLAPKTRSCFIHR